ncbi:RHS repeat domain-containing protein [Aliidiomarina iranensis]|uniref:RHS repeat domain-containing protein n=1 Tax=Aliidiomarina iranensis TaxID=1434071 RepID=UPI00130040EC|nr:RHS repeat-associated core domain-containing protein [Aliidiomarina iranensis]
MITDDAGQVEEKLSFDAFGKRRAVLKSNNQAVNFTLASILSLTHKGYTGHEQVDHASVVQMGGRIYDAHIGRFLQADPFVQSPSNSQNFNRYSYVLNNPLSYTDPSGYLFKKLNKILGKFAPIVSIAIMLIPGGQMGAAILKGFASGGIGSGSLRGALIGAFSGAAFYDIGQHYNQLAAKNQADSGLIKFGGNKLTSSQVTGQITAHAMVGGVAASLQGGKFGHGFFSAGVTKAIGTPLNDHYEFDVVAGTISSAIVGGTASAISGGKFANGATTGAMQALFNHYSYDSREEAISRAEELVRDNYEMANPRRRYGVQLDLSGLLDADIGTFVIRKTRWWGLLPDEYIVFRSANRNGGRGLHPEHGTGGPVALRNVEAWVVANHDNIDSTYYLNIAKGMHTPTGNVSVHIYSPVTRQFTVHTPSGD